MPLNESFKGKTLSFELSSGIRYTNYKLLALLDVGTVVAVGFQAAGEHHQNYPYMPPDSPDDFTAYAYAKFVDPENKILYVGVPWIKEGSITVLDTVNYNCLLLNPTTAEMETFRSILVASGFEGRFKLTVA